MLIDSKQKTKSINIETSQGNPIDNNQLFDITLYEKSEFKKNEKEHPYATFKGDPTPIYNCHGLTFATKRTRIYKPLEINKILYDDNYVEVNFDEILPGDILVYYTEEGDAEHSGIVLSKPDDNISKQPLVLSKWGKFKEVIHLPKDCPYREYLFKYYRRTA